MNETIEYFLFLALVLALGFGSFILLAKVHDWRVGLLVDDEPEIIGSITGIHYWKKGIPEWEGIYLGYFMYHNEKAYGECAVTAEGKVMHMGEEIDVFFGWLDYPEFPQELPNEKDDKTNCD